MIKSYLSRSELGAPPLDEAELPALFATFPRDPLLHVISRMSVLLDVHGWDDARAQQLILSHFAPFDARPVIRRFLERDPGSVLVGRQALLSSLRLAGAFGSTSVPEASMAGPHGVLPILTTIADHLDPWILKSAARPTERFMSRYLFANLLVNDRAAHRDLYVRYFDIYGECWQAAAAKRPTEVVSVDDFFKRETGIPMSRFFDIAVAITMFVESEAPAEDGLLDVAVLAHDAATFDASHTRTRPVRRSSVRDFFSASILTCFATRAATCSR